MSLFPASGGSDKYASTGWQSVGANVAPSFTTVAKAKAVWIVVARTDNYTQIYTNINESTGEINDSNIRICYSNGSTASADWYGPAVATLIKTDNSVSCSTALMNTATKQMMIYTY